MRSRNFLFLALLWLAVPAARAQELTIRSASVRPPESDTLNYLEIKYGQETFTMIPPTDWRMQTDAQTATIRFHSRTGTLTMTLRFTTNAAAETLSSTDALRGQVVPTLSDATLIEEFPAYSGGDSPGKGVVLGFTLESHALRCRAVALPMAEGCVHFVLMCGADEFKIGQRTFGAMLTSFQRVRPTRQAVAKR